MTIAKLRTLGKYGVITDVDPYDLPPEAFSMGVNVRFRNGRVHRGLVFRSARQLSSTNPRFVFANEPTSGLDLCFLGYQDGRVVFTTPTAEVDYSIAGYTPNISEGTWTGTHLADIVYINREDRVPWFLDPASAQFQELTNWDPTYRAKLIRGCGGALVALNVTKGAINFPTMVKTSSFALAGAVPASWDITDPSTNATENILAELEGSIVDAQSFGSNLIIYGVDQAWIMQQSAGFELFDYYKLPFQKGAINANCVVEIDGKHYVMGPEDIWCHDGVSEQSLCDGLVRDFIYSSINLSKANRCFVVYNAALKEIHFCYVSGDQYASFLTTGGCNRQAVYNLVSNTWTFDDLPSVYSGTRANLNIVQTYDTVAATYATVGGTYLDQEDSYKRTVVYVGDTTAAYGLVDSLYAFDLYGTGSTVSFAVDTNATKPAHLERDGIDLDQIQGVNLPDYKVISSIYPLARVDADATSALEMQFGSADYFGQSATFDGPVMAYDGNTEYRLDYNMAGRYLSFMIDFADYKTFSISGFDFDVIETGSR